MYALRRLARGLGSGRSGARQGFALALTAAFSEIPLVSLPDGLKLLKSSLEPITQSTKGAEARDILMGQLFGVAALARAMAARLAAGETTEEEAVAFGTSVAEEVSALASSKAYLAESAAAVILELADAVGDSMTAVIDASPTLSAWLATPAADAGPEVVLPLHPTVGLPLPSRPRQVRRPPRGGRRRRARGRGEARKGQKVVR